MSSKLLAWAFETRALSNAAKLALLHLADAGQADEWMNPDRDTLCQSVNVDAEYLQYALQELEFRGWLEFAEVGDAIRLTPYPERDAPQGASDERRARPVGFVYFIRSLDLIKIGTSRDPEKRIKGLRTTWPNPITVLKITHGGYKTEREYHERFAELRHIGEWFHAGSDLVGFIDSLDSVMELA